MSLQPQELCIPGIKGPLVPLRGLRVCQGPSERGGRERRAQGTGRSGPPPPLPLQGGCLGGDTPVNLSGRGCHCADVRVCMCVCVCVYECV